MPLPNCLIIGAQKSASRWLRINLGEHPEVFTHEKILHYFNRHYEQGLDWYSAQFSDWSGEPIVGEASPTYMLRRSQPAVIAERIDGALPGVKLLAILRNPVDRAYSAFIHHMWRGRIPPEANLNQLVKETPPEEERFQLIAGGWYAASLEPYVERFGDRLRIYLQEDSKADPHGVYRSALEHVGAEPDFVPDGLTDVIFSRKPPPESEYAEGEGGRRSLRADERAELYEFFRADLDRLEELIGRDLSVWRPT